MYDTGYYATGYYSTGYYMRGALDEFQGQYIDPFRNYTDLALKEDEEMIIIVRAFLEILSRWH